jgi:heme exporter protein CcmD
MTEWLLARGPWSFIWLAYAVFFIALLVDAIPGLSAESRLRRELQAQLRRRSAAGAEGEIKS